LSISYIGIFQEKWVGFIPKILNGRSPFNAQGLLFNPARRVLDTAMGYGVNLAQTKLWYPEAMCIGIDKWLQMDGAVWKVGYAYYYGHERKVVNNFFGRDLLKECEVYHGDARTWGSVQHGDIP